MATIQTVAAELNSLSIALTTAKKTHENALIELLPVCDLCDRCDACRQFVLLAKEVEGLELRVQPLRHMLRNPSLYGLNAPEPEVKAEEVKELPRPPQEGRIRVSVGNYEGEFHTDDLPLNGGSIEANGDGYLVQFLDGILYLTPEEDGPSFEVPGFGLHFLNFAGPGEPENVFMVHVDQVEAPMAQQCPLVDIGGAPWNDETPLTGFAYDERMFACSPFNISSGALRVFGMDWGFESNGTEFRLVDKDKQTCVTFPCLGRHMFRAENEDGEEVTIGIVVVKDVNQPIIQPKNAQRTKRSRSESDEETEESDEETDEQATKRQRR
jgi:hypothetical protein